VDRVEGLLTDPVEGRGPRVGSDVCAAARHHRAMRFPRRLMLALASAMLFVGVHACGGGDPRAADASVGMDGGRPRDGSVSDASRTVDATSPADADADADADAVRVDGGGGEGDGGSADDDAGAPDAWLAPTPLDHVVFIQMPAGNSPGEWRASTGASGLVLEGILEPLAPLADKVTIVRGLDLRPAFAIDAEPQAALTLLTADDAVRSDDGLTFVATGPSIDFTIASAFADVPIGNVGLVAGATRGLAEHLTWSAASAPIPAERDPGAAFARLFGSIASPVPADIAALGDELAAAGDLTTLAAYREALAFQLDIARLALRYETTRVITISLCSTACQVLFDWLGATTRYHELSHQSDAASIAVLLAVQIWFAEQVAAFASALDAIPVGDGGTLLDHTLIVWASELGEAYTHRAADIPVTLIGNVSGRIASGEIVTPADGRPHADLLVTVARAMGLDVTTFGDPALGAEQIDALLIE
jgi:hypothetical protein